MYVVSKEIKGHTYLYLYVTRWVKGDSKGKGRPKKMYVKYLGKPGRFTDEQIKEIMAEEQKRLNGEK